MDVTNYTRLINRFMPMIDGGTGIRVIFGHKCMQHNFILISYIVKSANCILLRQFDLSSIEMKMYTRLHDYIQHISHSNFEHFCRI